MKPSPIHALAARAQRLAFCQASIDQAAKWTLILGAAAVGCHVLVAAARHANWAVAAYGTGVVCVALTSLCVAALRLPSKLAALRTVDRGAGACDRFGSSFVFQQQPSPDAARRLQIEEAAQFVEANPVDLLRIFPLDVLRFLRNIGLVAIAASIVFTLEDHIEELMRGSDLYAASEAQLADPETLAQLRSQLEEMRRNKLGELAEEELDKIRESLDEIDLSKGNALEQIEEAAFEIEKMKQELERDLGRASELAAALDPLKDHAELEAIAEAIKHKQMEQAGQHLRELAEKLEKGELRRSQQAAMARLLKEAAGNLGKLDKTLAELMSQASAKLGPETVADLATEMEARAGLQNRAMEMDRLLAELEFLKAQLVMAQAGAQGRSGQDGTMAGLRRLGGECGGSRCVPGRGLGAGPTAGGLFAGVGTSDAREAPNRVDHGAANSLVGAQWAKKGVSQVRIVQNLARGERATVGTAEVMSNVRARSEDALYREKIPLGRRWHVKRYFEAIRP